MASLLYGAGLRLRECLKLRVKDIDFEYRQITVRDGKGGKDRVTMLPTSVIEPLKVHIQRVKTLHERDVAEGYGDVELPDALDRKYPRLSYELAWKFVFPSRQRSVDPKTGVIRRHHVYEIYTHVLNKGGRGVRVGAWSRGPACGDATAEARVRLRTLNRRVRLLRGRTYSQRLQAQLRPTQSSPLDTGGTGQPPVARDVVAEYRG
jgi:integrase